MRFCVLALFALSLSSCATLNGFGPNEYMSTYELKDLDAKALKGKAGLVSEVEIDRSSINFKFLNDTKKTSKIIWDESSIVLPDGTANRVLPYGKKFSEATGSSSVEIVPVGATISTGVSRAAVATYTSPVITAYGPIGGGWDSGDLIPCGSNKAVHYEQCAGNEYSGRKTQLLLAVEQDGKKYEYKIEGTLVPSEKYSTWLANRVQPSHKTQPAGFQYSSGTPGN